MANPSAIPPLLPALLHVGPDELLGVLLEHLVDLVENRVHVVGELLLPLPDLLGGAGLHLVGLFGAPSGLPLTACVLRCHIATSVSPNAIVTRESPAQSRRTKIGTKSRPGSGRVGTTEPSVLAGQGGDQFGGGAAAVEQVAHVRLGTAQRLERGHALQ